MNDISLHVERRRMWLSSLQCSAPWTWWSTSLPRTPSWSSCFFQLSLWGKPSRQKWSSYPWDGSIFSSSGLATVIGILFLRGNSNSCRSRQERGIHRGWGCNLMSLTSPIRVLACLLEKTPVVNGFKKSKRKHCDSDQTCLNSALPCFCPTGSPF